MAGCLSLYREASECFDQVFNQMHGYPIWEPKHLQVAELAGQRRWAISAWPGKKHGGPSGRARLDGRCRAVALLMFARKHGKGAEVRLDAQARKGGQPNMAFADDFQFGSEQRTQRIGIGIDLEQAVATDGGQEMRRGQ